MSRSRVKTAAVIACAVLFSAGLLLRTPIRKAWKRHVSPVEISGGQFQNPEGLAVDTEGNLYVADQDRGRITMFDRSWKPLMTIDTVEGYVNGDGEPSHITRGCNLVAIAPRRLVLVAYHNVAEIDLTGPKPKLVRIVGSRGSGPGQMDGPEGLSCDANGDVYVTDEHNRRINVFDRDGKYVRSWSVPQDPQTVRVWKDRVYVALNKRNYIACYSKDGVEQFRIGHEAAFPLILWITIPAGIGLFGLLLAAGKRKPAWVALGAFGLAAIAGSSADYLHHDSPGQFRMPDHILVSRDGASLFITDRGNARIQVTDLEGNLKRTFGSPGRGPGQFRDPKDLGWDADGNLIVCDSDNHRLQVLSPEGKHLRTIE